MNPEMKRALDISDKLTARLLIAELMLLKASGILKKQQLSSESKTMIQEIDKFLKEK